MYVNEWGAFIWYKDDKIHREDGPAIIRSCGENNGGRMEDYTVLMVQQLFLQMVQNDGI